MNRQYCCKEESPGAIQAKERWMNPETHESEDLRQPQGRCALGRKARLGIAALGLLSLGLVAGALIAATVEVAAHGEFGRHGKSGHGNLHSLEEAHERAKDKVAWMIGSVDATPEQEQRTNEIVANLVDDVYPLAQQHRENRRALIAELSRPTVNRQVLEEIRQAELSIAASASAELVEALSDLAGTLTHEQRQQLTGLAAKFRHH